MKKLLALTLCLMLLSATALAQSAGNLNNGGFVETDGESLFIARTDGVYRTGLDGENAVKIADDRASNLQYEGGLLYYLAEEYATDEWGDTNLASQTPVSCLPDGTDRKELGEARRVGLDSTYPDDPGEARKVTSYVGYRGFVVSNGKAYFLGNNGESGSYTCSFGGEYDAGDENAVTSATAQYDSGIALFTMALDGSAPVALTGTLGNSVARMALDGEKIYVAAGYADVLYAYNFVRYGIYATDGAVISAFDAPAEPDRAFLCDLGGMYHITEAVLPDENDMLVSLSDSEGDFVASQLFRLNAQGALTFLAVEQDYVSPVRAGDKLVFVGSEAKGTFYDDSVQYADSLGIYVKDVSDDALGEKICALPQNEYMNRFALSVLGDWVYFAGADGILYRVSMQGGETQVLSDAGFAQGKIDFVSEY